LRAALPFVGWAVDLRQADFLAAGLRVVFDKMFTSTGQESTVGT